MLKEDSNTGVMAFCPVKGQENLYAVATRLDRGQDLILSIQILNNSQLNYKLSLNVALNTLQWVEDSNYKEKGLLIGGQQDGQLIFIDPALVMKNSPNSILNVEEEIYQEQPVNSLQQNFKNQNLVAIGGDDVLIVDTSHVTNLNVFAPGENLHENSHICAVAWNVQVSHILASTSQNGLTVIWNLKINQPITQFYLAANLEKADACLSWSPINGTQLASTFNEHICKIQIWDLKSPQSPVRVIEKVHHDGITDLQWSMIDTNLILTAGLDNRICVYNYVEGEQVCIINLQETPTQVIWSKIPGLIGVSTNQGSCQIHQLTFNEKYAPKWITKTSCMNINFNNDVVSFDVSEPGLVTFYKLQIQANPQIQSSLDQLEQIICSKDIEEIYQEEIQSEDSNWNNIWHALKAVYSKEPVQILSQLNFNKDKIIEQTNSYTGKLTRKNSSKIKQLKPVINQKLQEQNAEDFFDMLGQQPKPNEKKDKVHKVEQTISLGEENLIVDQVSKNVNWNAGAEKLIKQNLIINNIQGAIDVCFKSGRYAEGLLIALKNKELLEETITSFYDFKNNDINLKKTFHPLIEKNVEQIIQQFDHEDWEECLGYILSQPNINAIQQKTYLIELGQKLKDQKQIDSALVCYILALDVDSVIKIIDENLQKLKKIQKKMELLKWSKVILTLLQIQQLDNNETLDNLCYNLAYCALDCNNHNLAFRITQFGNVRGELIGGLQDLLYWGNIELQEQFKQPVFKWKQVHLQVNVTKEIPVKKQSIIQNQQKQQETNKAPQQQKKAVRQIQNKQFQEHDSPTQNKFQNQFPNQNQFSNPQQNQYSNNPPQSQSNPGSMQDTGRIWDKTPPPPVSNHNDSLNQSTEVRKNVVPKPITNRPPPGRPTNNQNIKQQPEPIFQPKQPKQEQVPTHFTSKPVQETPSQNLSGIQSVPETGDNKRLKQNVQSSNINQGFINQVQQYLSLNLNTLQAIEKNPKRYQVAESNLLSVIQLLEQGKLSQQDVDSLRNLIDSSNNNLQSQAMAEYKNLCSRNWEQNKNWLSQLKKLLK